MTKEANVDWCTEQVVKWLTVNGWSSAIDIFIAYNIHHDRFLNLTMENVNELLQNVNISVAEKERLVFSIQKIKAQRQRIAIPSYNNREPSPRKNSSNFDISQFIPKRTSSNETNVIKMLEAFQPTLKSNKSHSPRIHANDNTNILSKLFGKRLPLPTCISEDRRIQVTLDADTFIRLWIKKNSNSLDIKYAVLYKLAIEAEPDYFLFYHENGLQSTIPLNDDEIVYLCQTSDDTRTNRVLVVPITGYNLLRQQRSDYRSNYSTYYVLTNDQMASPTGIQLSDPETPLEETPFMSERQSSSEVWSKSSSSPYENKPVPLWHVPPKDQQPQQPQQQQPVSLWHVPPTITTTTAIEPTKPVSLWPISPSTTVHHEPESQPVSLWHIQPNVTASAAATTTTATTTPSSETESKPVSLWHVQPSVSSSTTTTSTSHLWPTGDQRTELSVEGISLYDPPTPINDKAPECDFSTTPVVDTPPSPIGSDKTQKSESTSTTTTNTTNTTTDDTVMVGERPSVEKLYRDIDKYLPGHDLDTEILVEPTPATPGTTTPAAAAAAVASPAAIPPVVSRRLLGHRQSVRVVAKQAHQRWKQATNNVIMVNHLLRRKSTKMWDRQVERVKPGQERNIITDIPTTKMQWMRGNLIGRGSFGRVYHALNIATGDWIAVKQVDAPVTQSDHRNQDLKAASDALYREIRLLKDLDHENIVQYLGYDSNLEEGHIYIFLEYVPGGSISSLLSQYQYFDEPLVKYFTRQILSGLQYLHTRNILHRDIKAGNVLIDFSGICKITDFGLSKNQQEGAYDPMANNSTMRGTVFWMAPEVLTNNYSAKVDVWSLGCTVLEMITGEHPWMHLSTLAALYQIGKLNAPAIPTHISDEAKDFLQLCLAIKPEDRPTASELLLHPFVQSDTSFDFKASLKLQKAKEKL
ncbi:hypothetical protein BD770DRAFT_447157 [Pilaira anomala]|nr:hypothetical protein BD770DRAFT_447157 [Pilaira anomala]